MMPNARRVRVGSACRDNRGNLPDSRCILCRASPTCPADIRAGTSRRLATFLKSQSLFLQSRFHGVERNDLRQILVASGEFSTQIEARIFSLQMRFFSFASLAASVA